MLVNFSQYKWLKWKIEHKSPEDHRVSYKTFMKEYRVYNECFVQNIYHNKCFARNSVSSGNYFYMISRFNHLYCSEFKYPYITIRLLSLRVYSTMLGKKASLVRLKEVLRQNGVSFFFCLSHISKLHYNW